MSKARFGIQVSCAGPFFGVFTKVAAGGAPVRRAHRVECYYVLPTGCGGPNGIAKFATARQDCSNYEINGL